MPKTKTISNIIFFTVSSLETIEKTAKYLSVNAQQAYMERDFSKLLIQAEKLLQLTPKHQIFGEFYKAQALSNSGEITIATAIYEELVDSAVSEIRAASLLALGVREYRNEKYENAVKLISQASRLGLSNNLCAPITVIRAHTLMSAIYGAQGDSEQSLKALGSVEPLVKAVGSSAPMILGQHLNAKAYEEFQLGNLQLASHLIKKALSLSISVKYPEWRETQQEIEENLSERNLFVEVPHSYNRSIMIGNVLQFPVPKNCFQVNIATSRRKHGVLDFAVNSTTESEARFDALIGVFDSICVEEKTGFKIEGKLRGDDFEYKNNLHKSRIIEFFKIIENVKAFETANPLPVEEERLSESTTQNKVTHLKPKLENTK